MSAIISCAQQLHLPKEDSQSRDVVLRLLLLLLSKKKKQKDFLRLGLDEAHADVDCGFCFCFKRTKIQFVIMRYTYIHDGSDGHYKKIDSHHIVIQKGRAWIFIWHLFLSLFSSTALYHILGNIFTALLCSMILSAFFIKSLYQKLIVKESVMIFPAFGVQLETHYNGGRVFRRFIPIDKILKPVLNEHVTPFTCYWRLGLMVRGKDELVLAFKEIKLPVKILIPIWKALCVATCTEETMDAEDT